MSALIEITAEKPFAPPPEAKPDGVSSARVPDFLYVIDTTAIQGRGNRIHEMKVDGLIKPFTFEPGKALKLPFPVAIKFLKIPAFKRTNEEGDLQPYHRQPKQPHELAAGEKFELKDHQTVAEYSELSNMSLLQRALELPGGELLPDKGNRQALIDFIVKTTVAQREANAVREAKPTEPVELADIPPIDDYE